MTHSAVVDRDPKVTEGLSVSVHFADPDSDGESDAGEYGVVLSL